jgi:hypothetical protein
MKKKPKPRRVAEMRAEYDFRGGVRGKYAVRYRQGTNLVLLDPDVAATFPDSEAVNHALRALLSAVPKHGRSRGARSSQ